LRTILQLVKKEYRLFLSDRVAVSLTFIVPMLLIALWGAIFGRADSGPTHLRLAFLNASTSSVGKSIEKILDTTQTFMLIKSHEDEKGNRIPFDTSSIQEYVRKGNAPAALVIPQDAFTDTSFGLKLKFYYDPKNEMEMQIIQGVLTQTIMSQIPDMFVKGLQQRAAKFLGPDSGKAFNKAIASTVGKYFHFDAGKVFSNQSDTGTSLFPSSRAQRDFFKNIMDFQSEQLVGKEVANPWATRSVGGWAMMFLMFSLTASASSLFEEKQSGVVLRILASPISRIQILWGKYLYNMSLGIIQLIVLFGAGALLFKIDILSNFFNLVLVVVAASAACTSFGMVLAALSKTSAQARGLGTFLILAMSSIGGAWFPTSFMPDFIQLFSKITLVYWSMDGFLQVLWRGATTVEILPNVGILLGIAVIMTAVSMWQFKKGHVF
jgi:ABC-2 type transport system permease protein